jgi:hypothetical protein
LRAAELRKSKTSLCDLHVLVGPVAGDDEVIAMDRGRHGGARLAGLHELEDGHLRGGVLHGHAVGAQQHEGFPALEPALLGVVEMGPDDLLGQGQGLADHLAGMGMAGIESFVDGFHIDLLHSLSKSGNSRKNLGIRPFPGYRPEARMLGTGIGKPLTGRV